MSRTIITKSMVWGLLSAVALLAVYFVVVSLISDADFAVNQFRQYWYFIVSLAVGFGIQIGLYSYLKQSIKNNGMLSSGKTVAVTGTTSTLSMISCCAHYLVNIIPILGITGIVGIVAQYQTELLGAGLLLNLLGILYIASQIIKYKKQV